MLQINLLQTNFVQKFFIFYESIWESDFSVIGNKKIEKSGT
jgi:hypothetical protein